MPPYLRSNGSKLDRILEVLLHLSINTIRLMAQLDDRFNAISGQLDTIGGSLGDASDKLKEGQEEILKELGKFRDGGPLTDAQETLLQSIEAKVAATSGVADAIDQAAKAMAEISPPLQPEQPDQGTETA